MFSTKEKRKEKEHKKTLLKDIEIISVLKLSFIYFSSEQFDLILVDVH